MSKIVYASNKAAIGDGTRITRVSGGGTKLEVMVDAATGRFSEVVLVADAPVVVPPPVEPPPVVVPPPVTTPPIGTIETVTSLGAATGALRNGKSVKLAAGTYTGALDLKSLDGKGAVLEATNAVLNGYVTLQSTKGVGITGLAVNGTIACVDIGQTCSDLRFVGMNLRGKHTNLRSANYYNMNGIYAPYGVGNIAVVDCVIAEMNCGIFADSAGDFTVTGTTITNCADDGWKIALNSPGGIKRFVGNTVCLPVVGNPDAHCDAGQFTAIGVNSATAFLNLVFEDNICFENSDLSDGVMQGFTSFSDGSGAGRMFKDAVWRRNITMTSYGNGQVLYNINGGTFTDNKALVARVGQGNTPFIAFGAAQKTGSVTESGNLAPAQSQYPNLFPNWRPGEKPKTRADVLRMLAR